MSLGVAWEIEDKRVIVIEPRANECMYNGRYSGSPDSSQSSQLHRVRVEMCSAKGEGRVKRRQIAHTEGVGVRGKVPAVNSQAYLAVA